MKVSYPNVSDKLNTQNFVETVHLDVVSITTVGWVAQW